MHRIKVIILSGILSMAAMDGHAASIGGSSVVLTGNISGSGEWSVPVTWGDGIHDLYQIWSVGDGDQSGFAYGTFVAESNVDVYNAGVVDPLTVADASAFIYTNTNVEFLEGETLFFRGRNGYYGAWVIDNIYPSNSGRRGSSTYLDGRWFFQGNGGSDFTATTGSSGNAGSAVPEPGPLVLLGLGLGGLGILRRRRPASR